jgi:hypothetical protein
VPWTERVPTLACFLCVCLPFHFGPGLPAFDSGVFPRDSGVFRSINYQTSISSHPSGPCPTFSLGPVPVLNNILLVSISRSPLYCAGWLFFPFLHTAFTAARSHAIPAPHSLWPQARPAPLRSSGLFCTVYCAFPCPILDRAFSLVQANRGPPFYLIFFNLATLATIAVPQTQSTH